MTEKKATLSLTELGLIAGTRGLLGVGIGLLLAKWFNDDQRKATGWTLFTIGAVSTVPLAMGVLGEKKQAAEAAELQVDIKAA